MLVLGAVGIVVPIFPTTPFVIVAAACFSSTPTLYIRVMKIPFISEYITNYKTNTGLSRKTVTVSLVFLWVMLMVSAIAVKNLIVILCLAIIGIAVTAHIVMMSKPRKQTGGHQ